MTTKTKRWLFNSNKKEQGLIRTVVLTIAIYSYIACPVEPPDHLQSADIKQVTGMPRFRETLTSKMSDMYFFVDDLRLNCSFGIVDGANGCGFFRDWISKKEYVTATYYLMPTRLGFRYPMLLRLEQDDREVVSQKMMDELATRSHISSWESYFAIFGVLFLVLIAAFLIDRATIKRNCAISSEGN